MVLKSAVTSAIYRKVGRKYTSCSTIDTLLTSIISIVLFIRSASEDIIMVIWVNILQTKITIEIRTIGKVSHMEIG